MKEKILLIGYGSIGKRHARNLIKLGARPNVLTRHPDELKVKFSKDIECFKGIGIEYCIISSPTARHLEDLRKCIPVFKGLKGILIEKPLEASYLKAAAIKGILRRHRLNAFVAYNLRFISAFDEIRKFIRNYRDRIKIVEVVAGQDLREWRPCEDLRQGYSAHRELGGGVDLDLSHEIDYILWLFGNKFKDKIMYRAKISSLRISSPDIFKLVLGYKKFIVDITLDYIRRPKTRQLRIICEDGVNLFCDFVTGRLMINGKIVSSNKDDIDESYRRMLRAFLGIDRLTSTKVCSINEGLDVLKVLEV